MNKIHTVDPICLEPDHRGFYVAVCECGWKSGPVPDLEETVDALMDHVRVQAITT